MGEGKEGQAEELACELCAGSGVVPTRTPNETGELYDDCRGCVDGERLTGAEAEALRDRADRAEADAHVARWELEEARAEMAHLTDDLRRECEASQQIAFARDRFRAALADIAAMSEYDQIDAHRLCDHARRALTPTGADHE